MLTQSAMRSDAIRLVPASRATVSKLPNRSLDRPVDSAGSLAETMSLMGALMTYPRNAEIFGEGEPADYIYKVISGGVRVYKILSDGRRQIGGFYLPGDIFGLQFDQENPLSAEAINDTKVLVVKRSTFNAMAGRNSSIARDLFETTGREMRRMQKRILLLVKSAQERVASFLLEMAERLPSGGAIDLPMSRQDIADYLGLTIETVSRTLTSLETSAVIALPSSRRVVLRDRLLLNRLNG
jgi:CRP-like cAMP-binding protein